LHKVGRHRQFRHRKPLNRALPVRVSPANAPNSLLPF
jgi:hypothetical protein